MVENVRTKCRPAISWLLRVYFIHTMTLLKFYFCSSISLLRILRSTVYHIDDMSPSSAAWSAPRTPPVACLLTYSPHKAESNPLCSGSILLIRPIYEVQSQRHIHIIWYVHYLSKLKAYDAHTRTPSSAPLPTPTQAKMIWTVGVGDGWCCVWFVCGEKLLVLSYYIEIIPISAQCLVMFCVQLPDSSDKGDASRTKSLVTQHKKVKSSTSKYIQ